MKLASFISWIIIPFFISTAAAQQACLDGFNQCSPAGASSREVPVIGPDLARFYLELIYTIVGLPAGENSVQEAAVIRRTDYGDSLCCAVGSACEMIQSFKIAFCWDRFTTSYFLPDGSYGSASNGSYRTPQGDTANLITGEYHMQDGTVGNMYDESPADKPESSDLPLPTPYTSAGVGAAIPASQLGAQLSQTLTATISTASPQSTSSTSSTSPETTTVSSTSASSGTTMTSPSLPITTSSTSAATSSEPAPIPQTTLPTSTASSDVPSETTSHSSVESASSTDSTLTSGGSGGVVAPTASGMTGTPGASSSSVNGSWPIIPPITNLAAATVVYCMAAKVLVWLVAAIMV
ncbi:uncharacterized protein AB675_5544 [Cyphellophora attinorum]|uniref:Uncharacterized protein n=1 Tax=Cyphellophora attinorum TaxID=1664694 RepID=A0A0N1HTA7_9EURO|nr:uncharacterized protein AB675_5544 [Phialophora attinorum]KPI42185.1 hypothetical protein AB675_5544 [Phialophora attinorum]